MLETQVVVDVEGTSQTAPNKSRASMMSSANIGRYNHGRVYFLRLPSLRDKQESLKDN